MKRYFIVLFLFSLLFTGLKLRAETDPKKEADKLYKAVLNEDFFDEKIKLGGKLGRVKIPETGKLLRQLLEDDSYWNRIAAAEGILAFGDKELDKLLVQTALKDFMIEDEVIRRIKKAPKRFLHFLESEYNPGGPEDKRLKVLETLSVMHFKETDSFLTALVLNKQSVDRKKACEYLLKNIKDSYQFSMKILDDPELREYALSNILQKGTYKDLILFTKILSRKEETRYTVLAYEAVQKWGNNNLKRTTFLNALDSQETELQESALYVFDNVLSGELKKKLGFLVSKGESQMVRIKSASRLLDYNTKDIVPYLITALKETYSIQPDDGIDIAVSFFTLGITDIFNKINNVLSQNDFEAIMDSIVSGLKRITKVNFGRSYIQWFDWSVYSGYSVEGVNIIQFLYSGFPDKRKKAVKASLKLLGYKNEQDYRIKRKIPSGPGENALLLALTDDLMKKGFLMDEN
ncbi:MAG: HEAT repeat domain-containing protein [Spirochaetales bacterium]|nr:HEAT repeat domain-containing protein [Spirochaetales bacterium]